MVRLLCALALVLGGMWGSAGSVAASNPHFVDDQFSETYVGDNVMVYGQEAGLDGQSQTRIGLSVEATCTRTNDPWPSRNTTATERDFPVVNGQANFALALFNLGATCPTGTRLTTLIATIYDSSNGLSEVVGREDYT